MYVSVTFHVCTMQSYLDARVNLMEHSSLSPIQKTFNNTHIRSSRRIYFRFHGNLKQCSYISSHNLRRFLPRFAHTHNL
jgi:hypothetical protein